MAKIWGYISAVLGGMLIMAIAALKWFNGDEYNTTVKKLKQKRVRGDAVMSPVVESAETGRKGDNLTRQQKRAINKAARDAKKLKKKL